MSEISKQLEVIKRKIQRTKETRADLQKKKASAERVLAEPVEDNKKRIDALQQKKVRRVQARTESRCAVKHQLMVISEGT